MAAWVVLFPDPFRLYGESLMATTLFVSNLYFWHEIDYFAAAAEPPPLLHSWTLAVEEQFYIVFPLLLILANRYAPGRLKVLIWALALVSFGFCLWAALNTRPVAFYWTGARMWEFALGAAISFRAVADVRDPRLLEWMGFGGLALVLGSVIFMEDDSSLPGVEALIPCFGAALIIHSGISAQTMTSRLLSTPPLVAIGLISYSLYLWHWPIFAFYRQWHVGIGTPMSLGLIGVCLLVAWVSWRFVEQPFRRKAIRRSAIFATASVAMGVFLAGGALIERKDLLPDRFPSDVLVLAEFGTNKGDLPYRGHCFLWEGDKHRRSFERELCLRQSEDKMDVLLMGDSHAAHHWRGLSTIYTDINFLQATAAGCKASLKPSTTICGVLMDDVLNEFVPHAAGLDAIVIGGHWRERDIATLVDVVDYLKQYVPRIYVIGPVIDYAAPLPLLLARARLHDDSSFVDDNQLWEERKGLDTRLRAALAPADITYLSALDALCPLGQCRTMDEAGTPLQHDYGHLSRAGSFMIARTWKEQHLFP